MKKKLYILLALVASLTIFQACDFLDIVPDERPTEKDAFKNAAAARGYLYSCYGYLAGQEADPRHATKSIDAWTADEVVTPYEHETFAHFAKGTYTASNPYISYWNNVFAGIRQCYILIENVDAVPGLTDADKKTYKAEATFLIAYYHYLLIKNYGPTIIVRERADVDTAPTDFLGREPYDDCVNWVANKFDEAVSLGLQTSHFTEDYGRATVAAAKALKARMLLYAASPLFNGGSYDGFPNIDAAMAADADNLVSAYNDFKDKSGRQLISTTYSSVKWTKAVEACKAAIEQAEADGHQLYYATVQPEIPYPTNISELNVRMTLPDSKFITNTETIWASTTKEDSYSTQHKSTPFCKDEKINWKSSWNGLAPRLNMVEAFYTAKGLPIDKDPDFDYDNRFEVSRQTDPEHVSGATMALHFGREPRFYAWISFHNGYYEIARGTNDNAVNRIVTQYRFSDEQGKNGKNNDYSPSGYLNKKGVHPLFGQYSGGGIGSNQYPWPIIRLAELYLNYAEALIEVGGDANLELAKTYIDKVRERAGVPKLDVAWAGAKTPNTLNQSLLRNIVRQERQIELYLENQRFWDVRRWLMGSKYFNVPAYGLDITATKVTDLFTPTEVNVTREFRTPRNYLMPIPIDDINKNPNIVQNPGY